jgi:hypothetical protein
MAERRSVNVCCGNRNDRDRTKRASRCRAGGGHTYFINVYPSEAGVDFDLHIYDQNGNLVSWDETPAADAHGTVTPIITGPFRIVVNSVGGMAAYRVEIVG